MTFESLVYADKNTTLKAANDIIWDHKLNVLPIVDDDQRLYILYSERTTTSIRRTPTNF